MMNRMGTLVLGCALALGTASLGCGAATEEPDNAVAAGSKAPLSATLHGPARVVAEALADVPLRADQRTEIENRAAAAEQRHAPASAARKDFVEALASSIESGRVDRAALTP